jgi:leucyl/phenylalanyl-tRNA--protein transferase
VRWPPQQRIDPEVVLAAYCEGAFPMSDPDTGEVAFYTCSPRSIVPLDDRFHVPRSLARVVRSRRFSIRFNTAFAETIRACAVDRDADNRNWIGPAIVAVYEELHAMGFAHSLEAWRDGRLVGGLYGVALGGAFFGESMFCRPAEGGRDASKVCLVHLVEHLRERGFALLDTQYASAHLDRFGTVDLTPEEYLSELYRALLLKRSFIEPAR